MHQPFIDTRNFHELRLACNVVTYSDRFCLLEKNRALIESSSNYSPKVKILVDSLRLAQEKLAPKLPLTGTLEIWENRHSYIHELGVKTISASPEHADVLSTMDQQMNQVLLDTVFTIYPMEPNGPPSAVEVINLACQCLWLSELLALVIIGVTTVETDAKETCIVKPASDGMRHHLLRLWFGFAFEQASLHAGSAAIQTLAALTKDSPQCSRLNEAKLSALAVFSQHWRLPVDTGPVSKLLLTTLEPLLRMITHAIIASNDPKIPPLDLRYADREKIRQAYENVKEIQKKLPIVDQLFKLSGDKLTLGTRELTSASIETAERLAKIQLGKDWHGKITSDAQKEYFLNRIGKSAHIEILDFELLQHHSDKNIDLDVDFFIRDNLHTQIYGVQLKHLEKKARSGLLAWLSLFRERESELGNLVRQLENLTDLARTDLKCRSYLIGKGLTESECDRVIPIGIHNVGFVDFMAVQNKVLLYDLHTFANVLAGRIGVEAGVVKGRFFHNAINSKEPPLSLHDPDTIITAYLNDSKFKHLTNFSIAAQVSRKAAWNKIAVVACGVGL